MDWIEQLSQRRDYTLDIVCAECKQDIVAHTFFILPTCDHPVHKTCFKLKTKKSYKCPECEAVWQFQQIPEPSSYIT